MLAVVLVAGGIFALIAGTAVVIIAKSIWMFFTIPFQKS